MFYYCDALSEQRAARCIVAPGVALLERGGLPRDAEKKHPKTQKKIGSGLLAGEPAARLAPAGAPRGH